MQGSDHFTETVPLLDDMGHLVPNDVERDLDRRRGDAVGHRIRHRGAQLRQRHRDAERGTDVAVTSRADHDLNDDLRETKMLKNGDPTWSRTTSSKV